MADRHLIQKRKLSEEHQVHQIEIVAGIDTQSDGMRELRGFDVAGK